MEVHFRLAKEDILQAIQMELKRPFLLRLPEYLFYVSILAVIVYTFVAILAGYTQFLLGTLAMIGLFIFMVVNRWILLPRRAYKSYESSVDLRAPAKLVVSEEGLEFSNEYGHSRREWEHLVGWKENDELLLLYVSDSNAHLIPKRSLKEPDAYRFLRGKLDQHEIPYRSFPAGTWMAVIVYLLLVIVITAILLTRI